MPLLDGSDSLIQYLELCQLVEYPVEVFDLVEDLAQILDFVEAL